jgi:diadenylate cyclase
VSGSLSALEVEDLVTVRDIAETIQRAEMVRRIADEIEGYVIELGADGRLVQLQLEELTGGVQQDLRLVCDDYVVRKEGEEIGAVLARLAEVDDDDLIDGRAVTGVLNLPREADLDSSIQPRGYRLLAKIPRLPDAIVEKIVERFSNLPKLMRASIADLVEVEGVGEARARAIKDGLSRIAESSILERYA